MPSYCSACRSEYPPIRSHGSGQALLHHITHGGGLPLSKLWTATRVARPLAAPGIPIGARSVGHAPQFIEKSHITSRIRYAYWSYVTVLRTLKSELQHSPEWSLFYKNADSVICRLKT
jgi:hypothetical protein